MIRPSSRLGLLAGIAAALVAWGPVAAGTAPTRPDPAEVAEVAIDTSIELDSEILALVALGAFGEDTPPELQAVHDEWADYIAGYDRPALIGWAVDSDRDTADLLSVMREMGVALTPALERAAGPLTQADIDALEQGMPIPGDHLLYVRARIQLAELSVGNVPFEGSPEPVATPSATVPPTVPVSVPPAVPVTVSTTVPVTVSTTVPVAVPTTVPTTAPVTVAATAPATVPSDDVTTASETDGRSDPFMPMWWFIAALGVAAVGVVALVASLRRGGLRRRTAAIAPADQFEILAEAARRMTGALDDAEIARIALDQAMQMTGARHGAFVTVDGAGLTATATCGDVFSVRSFTGGLLSRVADTGQTVRRVAHDEPAITSLPAAVLAAPVIGGGRVGAILFLVRPDATPFTAEDDVAVARLTPVVASALAAASKHEDVAALTLTDSLTGLANRRALDADLASLTGAAPTARRVAVVMVDVDHFKHFNDRNGHGAGDDALRAVAGALRAGVRTQDRVYRYGGEEFSLVLPDVDRAEAERIAERVRTLVQQISVPGSADQPGGALTVSVGVAMAPSIEAADAALYDAKAAGRNRVVVTEPVS